MGSGVAPAYVGSYGIRTARLVEGQLVYQRDGGPGIILTPLGDDRFAIPGDDRFRLVFQRDRRNRVSNLQMHVADGRVLDNPRSE
ncbi:MAG: hypothetical protein QUV02_12675 [Maricaulis sp.]|uniref:hypothetical protein n=1 Tax=Maricaulis sp. TaxID=1486257 RepID=UPI001B0EF637|nr:hypothetical protein [Maricaulis sp.]MBO6728916.1 hypothetical protein [Maricaulis sp.]MBO6847571.1 hypothetical protein [Maricaulis sp.]MBO6877002.1 hypothetical protein [Maricaulis sp.]MDM7985295.1 hypothetical protein [Maricaulis sp.]